MATEFYKKVAKIQSTLKAPKSQYNKFGQYAYRNCEDILEAVKPLLAAEGLVLTINDEVITTPSNTRYYIKSTATITDGTSSLSNSALAREQEEQKGMNSAQVTGSTSSYARKYSLNGLFLIDDTKDADATNTHGKEATFTPTTVTKVETVAAPVINSVTTTSNSTTVATTSEVKPKASFRRPTLPPANVVQTEEDI